jgi:hypothetical protein
MSTDHSKVHETKREKLLRRMKDGDWHSFVELRQTGGDRYGARLRELKRLGWEIESRPSKMYANGKEYRLTGRGVAADKRVKVFLTEFEASKAAQGKLVGSACDAIHDALCSFRANKEKL